MLARLDTTALDAEVTQAQATLARAKAQLASDEDAQSEAVTASASTPAIVAASFTASRSASCRAAKVPTTPTTSSAATTPRASCTSTRRGLGVTSSGTRPPGSPRVTQAGATGPASGGWHRYARRVERHPWWFLLGGLAVVGVLAVPLFSMRLGHIDDGADPTSFTDRRAFDLISQGFGPGANGPLTLVVDATKVPAADRQALTAHVAAAFKDVPGAASISAPR